MIFRSSLPIFLKQGNKNSKKRVGGRADFLRNCGEKQEGEEKSQRIYEDDIFSISFLLLLPVIVIYSGFIV